MKNFFIILGLIAIFSLACRREAEVTSLSIDAITPKPGSVISLTSVISVDLKYKIVSKESSLRSRYIQIHFKTKDGSWIRHGGMVILENSQGTAQLNYPVKLLWDSPSLAHPVRCYFVLHVVNLKNEVALISQTGEIAFSE